MTRFIMPIILVGIAIAVFFVFLNPFYKDVMDLRAQAKSFDGALSNSKALETERDKLTAQYNSIEKNNLTKLTKLLPENIDNIRLILEIEQIASPYGMTLKDVKYSPAVDVKKTTSTTAKPESTTQTAQSSVATKTSSKEYGVWNLEFSTTGTYNNFLNFTRDLESNLRIVDVSSIQFSSSVGDATPKSGASTLPVYKYDFKIKTYWLKN